MIIRYKRKLQAMKHPKVYEKKSITCMMKQKQKKRKTREKTKETRKCTITKLEVLDEERDEEANQCEHTRRRKKMGEGERKGVNKGKLN